jgi:diguanylate cyclase (GGDEF)-like protein/putative nucleotidyltransferase with HDIG domain
MDPQIQVHYEREINLPFKDSLSDLFNHGFFQIALDREVNRSERHGEPFALALIDIDSFSDFNKLHGHLQGDRMLKMVAGLIRENIRQADLAARYSGDVFAAILTKSSIQSALVAGERIRQAVEKASGGDPTVSVGLSSYPGDASNRESLIKKAQAALLQAKIKWIEVGVDDFLTKPPNKVELLARIRSLINVKSLNDRLANFENVLFSLAGAVEAKDAYTQGHIQRVANMAVALARKMGLSKSEIESVRVGGILHDIGKIGVSRTILNKREPLTAQEQELMKAHTDVGYKICLPLKKNLGPALEVIRSHHEKLDGSGYPDGLKGEQISTVARVMTVVDIYDALVTDRPYRKRMAKEKALHILRQEAKEGKLDQKVIEALMELVSRGEIDDCEQDGFGD